MMRKRSIFGISLALLGLFGCDVRDRSPTQPEAAGGKGSARIALPRLPAEYLSDSAAQAWFSLSITGPGMVPISRTWPLTREAGAAVVVNGIPAGMRVFLGKLIKLDAVNGDTTVTHEGGDTAYIGRDSVSEVFLYLKASTLGSAHVCVEVEGWPSDSSCIPPPPPSPVMAAGCYALQVTKAGPIPGHDTVFAGSLRIGQWDTSVTAAVTWESGQVDSTWGIVRADGVVYLGLGGGGAFLFKSQFDSTGALTGWFQDTVRGISGVGRAIPKSCSPDTSIAARRCYAFLQTDVKGLSSQGRLAFVQYRNNVWNRAYTHWDGAASRLSPYTGSMDSGAVLEWTVSPPAGVFSSRLGSDSATYDIQTSGQTMKGLIRKTADPNFTLGVVNGTIVSCRETDFQL